MPLYESAFTPYGSRSATRRVDFHQELPFTKRALPEPRPVQLALSLQSDRESGSAQVTDLIKKVVYKYSSRLSEWATRPFSVVSERITSAPNSRATHSHSTDI